MEVFIVNQLVHKILRISYNEIPLHIIFILKIRNFYSYNLYFALEMKQRSKKCLDCGTNNSKNISNNNIKKNNNTKNNNND